MTDKRLCPVSVPGSSKNFRFCKVNFMFGIFTEMVGNVCAFTFFGADVVFFESFSWVERFNEHNPGSNKCKSTNVTNHPHANSDHKIDFAKPKILRTARNRTMLFILKTLSIDKLKPDINVDQLSITLYLFNTRYCFVFFSSFFFFIQCTALVSQEYVLSVCSSGTAACLLQQVLLNFSAILQLVLKCGYFYSRLVVYIIYSFRFCFLLMIDIAKSKR